jgi:hypothetical protein
VAGIKHKHDMALKTYVNEEHGFSAQYNANLIVVNPKPALSIIHGRSSVEGLPSFMVAIAEIPPSTKQADSANFFIYGIKNKLKIETVNIQHKELIKLSDGTEANYFELDWRYQRTGLVTSGVVVYRDGKLISILSTGRKYSSMEDLKQMTTSLVFK